MVVDWGVIVIVSSRVESFEVFPRSKDPKAPSGVFVLQRDSEPDLRFKGWLLAKAKTKPVSRIATVIDSGSRWFECSIYVTEGAIPMRGVTSKGARKIILEKIGCSDIPGETKRHQVFVCKDGAELARTLGADSEWKELYRKAEIDAVEDLV